MSKTFRPWQVEQAWLLPPSVRDLVPADDPAHFIREAEDRELGPDKRGAALTQVLGPGLARVPHEWGGPGRAGGRPHPSAAARRGSSSFAAERRVASSRASSRGCSCSMRSREIRPVKIEVSSGNTSGASTEL